MVRFDVGVNLCMDLCIDAGVALKSDTGMGVDTRAHLDLPGRGRKLGNKTVGILTVASADKESQ